MKAALNYSHGHLWRNVGSECFDTSILCLYLTKAIHLRIVIIVFWIAFVLLTALAVERLKAAGAEKSYLLYSRHNAADDDLDAADEEHGGLRREKSGGGRGRSLSAAAREKDERMKAQLQQTETVFTWQGVNYTVNVKDGTRQLLNQVQGYARPGQLLALMGSSGAGKSTLLDTLVSSHSVARITACLLTPVCF